MKISQRVKPLFRRLAPIAKVVQTATGVLGQLKEPTMFGVVNAVAGGLTSIGEVLTEQPRSSTGIDTALDYGFMVSAFRAVGADVDERPPSHGGKRYSVIGIDGDTVEIAEQNREIWYAGDREVGLELCRRVFDRALPPVVRVVDSESGPSTSPATLSDLRPEQAGLILSRTLRLLEGGRAILLEGRPGVGKTTIAQAIARDAALGRIVIADGDVLCKTEYHRRGLCEQSLRLLSPGVVIVDDIDKVKLPLKQLEMLRTWSRLVVMTANNGKHDAVLDAALMRPARIDEVFTIASDKPHRRHPFDLLPDADWEEVCDWPCAYVNEVEKRLAAGVELGLGELRDRMKLRTRSGEELL